MRMKKISLFLGALLILNFSSEGFAQGGINPNGKIDGLEELSVRKEIMIPMPDGVKLATDVSLPILQDDLGFDSIPVKFGPIDIVIPRLTLASKGAQYIQFPGQKDPYQLPIVLTRTPYGKSDPIQGQIVSLLGYANVLQDMRGRYRSEGTYYPMFSDSWNKNPYLKPMNIGHTLDTTKNHDANEHEDGYNTLNYVTNNLRWDSNGDSTIDEKDRLICNGTIGMFGASALANTQYQAAAVKKIDTSKPGLKCMLPIVGSCEFYQSTGHQNGVFRERIIDGWLRGQVERYDYSTEPDNSVKNGIHSLSDFGPEVKFPKDAAEIAIDFWSSKYKAHYPNSGFRSVMDVSHAPLNEKGESDPNGKISRYTNIDVPIYNLTGWWDIFIDGQIQTWQNLVRYVSPEHKKYQKLVIGPWAHQTIGSRSTGDFRVLSDGTDLRYPEAVGSVIGATLDNVSVENAGSVANSEVVDWFRTWMGSPMIVLPPQKNWQPIGKVLGSDAFVQVPADTMKLTFEEFFNFINGTGPVELKVRVKGLALIDSSTVTAIPIPATGQSLLGDKSGIKLEPGKRKNFDASAPDGVKNVRFYVVGPVKDGVPENEKVGNYWVQTDTFPLPNPTRQKLYFHGNSMITHFPPVSEENSKVYISLPDNPVLTHGGPNMIVRTPDDTRDSQGQMDFNDPQYRGLVLDRPKQLINGDSIPDIVTFSTPVLTDTFSVAGFPNATIYAKSKPLSQIMQDSTNCDFIVRVLDVYPDGRELYVFEGVVNARARDYARSWTTGVENSNISFSNIASDKIYEYTFRMLPIAYTWGKGHKMKVLISGTNYPRYQACPNIPLQDGEFFRRRPYEDRSYTYKGVELYPRKAIQTLHFSDVYAANIDFPILGKPMVTTVETAIQSLGKNINVYPNPATDLIAISAEDQGTYSIKISNLIGQVLKYTTLTENIVTVDTKDLPRGIYVVTITDNQGISVTKKVVLN